MTINLKVLSDWECILRKPQFNKFNNYVVTLFDVLGGESKLRLNLGAQGFWTSGRKQAGFYLYSAPNRTGYHVRITDTGLSHLSVRMCVVSFTSYAHGGCYETSFTMPLSTIFTNPRNVHHAFWCATGCSLDLL